MVKRNAVVLTGKMSDTRLNCVQRYCKQYKLLSLVMSCCKRLGKVQVYENIIEYLVVDKEKCLVF